MQLALSTNLLSRFSTSGTSSKLSKLATSSKPDASNTPTVCHAARTRPCTGRMARAWSR